MIEESSNRKTACKSISSGACAIYVVGSLISQFCIETFFLKTSHGQMFTLQFISNVLLFRAVGGFVISGGRGEAKGKPRHFVGLKDKVLL